MSRLKLLVAYSNESTFVPTTLEYLRSFKLHSRCEVSYLHVTNEAAIDIDLNQFDAVFNNYCARLCYPGYVSRSYQEALKRFRGVRLVSIQDEYDHTNRLRDAIQSLKFDVVVTCVPPHGHEYVYPRALFPDTEFVTVLTGYVPESLRAFSRQMTSLAERPVTVAYRGRRLPARYGRLGFEKYYIGERMHELCAARGINHDIASTEDKRIYGHRWYEFLRSCRATLGSESGSNVFDFDGSLMRRYENMKVRLQREPTHEEFQRFTDPLEAMVSMGQISPRVFEAAAVGTPIILFTGAYSDAVAPGEHYLELRKDFRNADEVLDALDDVDALQRMARRAQDELVVSGKYSYGRFVGMIDDTIERKRAEKSVQHSYAALNLILQSQPDPREATHREVPTAEPREFLFYKYREGYFANEKSTAELEAIFGASLSGFGRAVGCILFQRLKRWLVTRTPRVALALQRVSHNLRELKSRA